MKQIPRTGRAMMTAALLMLLAGSGCSPPPDMRDQRLVELARESMDRQAEQNRHLARQSEQIIEEGQKLTQAAQELVAHDAQARQELVAAQDRLNAQLNEQRAAIDAGRDQLEQERREIAKQRQRDPLVAGAIQSAALLLACLLPLAVCALVVWRLGRDEPDDAAVAELLVAELTSDQPRLLPGPVLRPALEHESKPGRTERLPHQDEPDAGEDLPF